MSTRILLQRIFYGFLAIAALVALFFVDTTVSRRYIAVDDAVGHLLRHGSAVPLAVVVVFLLGAVEFHHLLRFKASKPHTWFAYSVIVLVLLVPWFFAAGWWGNGATRTGGVFAVGVVLLLASIGSFVAVILRGQPEGALGDLGATWLMIVYLGFLGSFAMQLHCGGDGSRLAGAWLLLFVVLVTKASDIGAFFVGSFLGRHKLMPGVSPAKSIEGTVGGFAASALAAVLIVVLGSAVVASSSLHAASTVVDTFPTPELGFGLGVRAALLALNHSTGISPALRACILGVVLSAVGQLGDLVESCFKRDAGVKDSGHVVPRYGGILDLIDSLVLAIPTGWFLLTYVWAVV